jgi:hypothetical protein
MALGSQLEKESPAFERRPSLPGLLLLLMLLLMLGAALSSSD